MTTDGSITTDGSNSSHGSMTALARTGVIEVRAPRAAVLDFGTAWDYAPAPETTKVAIAPRYGHFINGRFVQPRDAAKRGGKSAKTSKSSAAAAPPSPYFATINPATEEVLSEIAVGSEADVDAAVSAAREAFPKWAGLRPAERAKYLFRIARRIQERARELSILETIDGGKPIRESRDVDIPLAAQHFFYHAGWADKLAYAFPGTPQTSQGIRPVGVCGQIIPWNFPLLMAAWKLAPALCCGNTCVLKPAETTSLTALRLAEIFEEVGLPPGVVNIVTGAGATGAAIVNHPGIDKVAFTGSTDVGKRIARSVAHSNRGSQTSGAGVPPASPSSTAFCSSSPRHKRLTLELGGKSPNIIFEDASIDQAVEGIIAGIFFNQGHVCCAGSRLLVQESILEEVTAKLAIRMASIRVGNPLDKNTDLGAINSRMQLAKIEEYLEAGQREGARLHVAGSEGAGSGIRVPYRNEPSAQAEGGWEGGTSGIRDPRSGKSNETSVHAADSARGNPEPETRNPNAVPHRAGLPAKGFWCRPCFFEGVQPSHVVAREEIFGPVLAVMSFRTPEEAITRANNTPYGLAAGVWTDKGSKIFEIARKLEAGVVWLNTYNRFDAASPFGGFKESGFGREGGMQGLRGYVNLE